jgi:hypothetical protein
MSYCEHGCRAQRFGASANGRNSILASLGEKVADTGENSGSPEPISILLPNDLPMIVPAAVDTLRADHVIE